ncbi:MAG TPA: GMC family oxidoreductase [Leptolyngbyaceae cyanobacterium M65_K2018_010]|nr:GMC family oxidoreductase [Leptolyngbyaceae cyanobacterium M65_K2018_010]
MFIDSRELSSETTYESDVCIIGAGPAGLTIAKELVGKSIEVCILESGGLTPEPEIQALNRSMESIGDQIPPCPNFPPAETMRTRQFGGTAHQWVDRSTGKKIIRYVPLEEVDFEERDWLPHSGWPITKKELDPYYERAHAACGLGVYSYEPETWSSQVSPQIAFDKNFIVNRMFHFGTGDIFTQNYRELIQSAPNVNTFLYASVYELVADETGKRITKARFINPSRKHFWVSAKQFILATGGLENARILLMSNQVQKAGLGNDNNLVGRFLMDHPLVRVGVIQPTSRDVFNPFRLYGIQKIGQDEVQAKPILSKELIKREGLLNANFFLLPRHYLTQFNLLRYLFPEGKSYVSKSVSSAMALSRKLRAGNLDSDAIKHLANVLLGLDDVLFFQTRKSVNIGRELEAFWPQNSGSEKAFNVIQVYSSTEQAPRPENRVLLGEEKDRFGYPKIQINWHWDEFSRSSFVKAATLFKKQIELVGLGKLNLEFDKGDPQLVTPSIHHNMGTTRMHDNPKQGVVDANCKVHGIANLFIAGSSTFPTGGYANPTLTIVALAIRLADHVKGLHKLQGF